MNIHLSSFQPSPEGSYSLSRVVASLQNGTLVDEFCVGASVVGLDKTSGEFILYGQGKTLRVKCDTKACEQQGLRRGSQVVLRAHRSNLSLIQPEVLELKEPSDIWILTQASREHLLRFQPEQARKWSLFLDTVRKCLKENQLLEVRTPSLVPNPGMEPELEPFSTSMSFGSSTKTYFLPTSQELHMKRLLASGYTDIFEIRSCFRNEELGPHHQPEFFMLEWYRGFTNLSSLVKDMEQLFSSLSAAGFYRAQQGFELKKYSLPELFNKLLEFDLRPDTSSERLRGLLASQNIGFSSSDDWNELFHRVFIEKIEPWIAEQSTPLLIYDFPPSLAALARLTPQGYADRFELYWGGLEIANAFHELNDPKEQRARFLKDQKTRESKGKTPLEIDESFMKALEAGLAPCAGIALGLDRLFMALEDLKDIRETRAFSFD